MTHMSSASLSMAVWRPKGLRTAPALLLLLLLAAVFGWGSAAEGVRTSGAFDRVG